ncbi:unnamed protein product, partial [Polarella glacialis]
MAKSTEQYPLEVLAPCSQLEGGGSPSDQHPLDIKLECTEAGFCKLKGFGVTVYLRAAEKAELRFVVSEAGAAAPSSASVCSGNDASGKCLPSSMRGSVVVGRSVQPVARVEIGGLAPESQFDLHLVRVVKKAYAYPGVDIEVVHCSVVKTFPGLSTASRAWFWKDDVGLWVPYMSKYQHRLEKIWAVEAVAVDLRIPMEESGVVICGDYKVDVKSMQQISPKTRKERPIARRQLLLHEDAPLAEVLLLDSIKRYSQLQKARSQQATWEQSFLDCLRTAEQMAKAAAEGEETALLVTKGYLQTQVDDRSASFGEAQEAVRSALAADASSNSNSNNDNDNNKDNSKDNSNSNSNSSSNGNNNDNNNNNNNSNNNSNSNSRQQILEETLAVRDKSRVELHYALHEAVASSDDLHAFLQRATELLIESQGTALLPSGGEDGTGATAPKCANFFLDVGELLKEARQQLLAFAMGESQAQAELVAASDARRAHALESLKSLTSLLESCPTEASQEPLPSACLGGARLAEFSLALAAEADFAEKAGQRRAGLEQKVKVACESAKTWLEQCIGA